MLGQLAASASGHLDNLIIALCVKDGELVYGRRATTLDPTRSMLLQLTTSAGGRLDMNIVAQD